MTEAKKHHYIPRSYLKNFAHVVKKKKDGDKYYVYVRFRGEKFHSVNIENICAETYFYSIPGVSEKNKNLVEKYYAENIDNLYGRIYDLVTNDEQIKVSQELREKILIATLSLYIRTPIFLDSIRVVYRKLLESLRTYQLGISERFSVSFFGRKTDLRLLNYTSILEAFESKNKAFILSEHFKILNDFIDFKKNDGIGINKLVDNSEYITSDNPVVIRNLKTGDFNDLFDPDNIIHLPINNKYLLTILPNSDSETKNTFNRITSKFTQALVINNDIERNSNNWIIGNPTSVNDHINDQIKYNEETIENYQRLNDLRKKAQIMSSFDELLREKSYIIDEEIATRLYEISKDPVMKDDPNIIRNIKELRKKGFL